MEGVIRYFERNLNKDVLSVSIDSTINKRCYHCGYGKIVTGHATLTPKKEYSNSDSDSDSDETSEDKNIAFIYNTGCLSYDSEMEYEIE